MNDYIIRGTAAKGAIAVFAALTTQMVEEARKAHQSSPIASAALGRTMTAAAMMSVQMKGEKDAITIQIKGDGPLGGIVVAADSTANVRGYVDNPGVYLPLNKNGKLDVAGGIGKNGKLNVIRDIGMSKPYIGYVDLISGEIAEDIAYYYACSEQIPTVLSLGVLVESDESIRRAGGFLIQLMPGAEDEIISYLEERLKAIPPVTALLDAGESPDSILNMILGEKELKLTEPVPCRFQCNCSRQRMEKNLISLGNKELISLYEEQHGAELQCHFCNKKYIFSDQELLMLINENN